jgi:hypothetical protein
MALLPSQAGARGDEGHQIIALIAAQYLEPVPRAEVVAVLGANRDNLTAHDIASEATWADRYRDSDRDGTMTRYKQTRQWHFVNIEIDSPDIDQACFNHPGLPAGVPASSGPCGRLAATMKDHTRARANPSVDHWGGPGHGRETPDFMNA